MGRPAKDGRFVNFLMDSVLFDKLVQVAEITGKTKTAVLETALRNYIEPFCNENGEISATEGVYVKKKKMCMVLDTVQIGDNKYCKILIDGEILTVPAGDVVI